MVLSVDPPRLNDEEYAYQTLAALLGSETRTWTFDDELVAEVDRHRWTSFLSLARRPLSRH